MVGRLRLNFLVLDALPYQGIGLHGTVRPTGCIRHVVLQKLDTIEDNVLCHATVVSNTHLLKAEEFRRLDVLQLFYSIYTVYCLLCVLNLLPPTTHDREGLLLRVYRLIVLCIYLQPWRGTARGLRSFRAFTTAWMYLLPGKSATCQANSIV